MTIDWAKRLGPYGGRDKVVELLEAPVRQLLEDGATTRPVAELTEIIAELDRLNRIVLAKTDENRRLANLRHEVEDALGVVDLEGVADCDQRVYSGWRGKQPCSRKAKVRIPSVGAFCRQHAKERVASEVNNRVDAIEKERIARGELTGAERIIEKGERVRLERHRAYFGRPPRNDDDEED